MALSAAGALQAGLAGAAGRATDAGPGPELAEAHERIAALEQDRARLQADLDSARPDARSVQDIPEPDACPSRIAHRTMRPLRAGDTR